jgi:hypothetical protein
MPSIPVQNIQFNLDQDGQLKLDPEPPPLTMDALSFTMDLEMFDADRTSTALSAFDLINGDVVPIFITVPFPVGWWWMWPVTRWLPVHRVWSYKAACRIGPVWDFDGESRDFKVKMEQVPETIKSTAKLAWGFCPKAKEEPDEPSE